MKFAAKTALCIIAFPAAPLFAEELTFAGPPTAPPTVTNNLPSEPRLRALAAVYTIGDPTPEEQLYVELINRARANPQAEALLLANTDDPLVRTDLNLNAVDLTEMINQFSIYRPAQPVAINSQLTIAARRHTADMFQNVFQQHVGSDGSTFDQRISAAGYSFSRAGENIYTGAKSVFHGHAGFEVDWGDPNAGPTIGGMQNPPGHRNTIHDESFREIGVGVIIGSKQLADQRSVGPQLVSQEFGTALNSTPLITGVAYYDLNGNGFYDIGEGIGGLSVKAVGVSSEAVTALSGGYTLPTPGNGTYALTFSGQGFTPLTQNVTVTGQLNQKLDFVPVHVAPTILGPINPAVGRPNSYNISVVPGANDYEWRVYEKIPARLEGAETGPANVLIDQTAGYEVIQNAQKKSGQSAFYLVHPASRPFPQSITLKPAYLLNPNSTLTFQSRLGLASPSELATAQISTNGGVTWQTVFTQAGTDDLGEFAFNGRTATLAQFAGTQARIRFVYEFPGGSFYPEDQPNAGWYIDDIQLTNAEEIADDRSFPATSGSFQFAPDHVGNFVLFARARTGHLFPDWNVGKAVSAIEATHVLEFEVSRLIRVGSELHFTINVRSGTAPASFALDSKTRLVDAWSPETSITGTQFLLKTAIPAGTTRFYRVRAN